jgi:L-malate glycosyltransferase
MKIVLLGAASSIHMQRWANGLVSKGHEVHVLSLHAAGDKKYDCQVHMCARRAPIGYLTAGRWVRQKIAAIKPNIVNAHYATGYGRLLKAAGDFPTLLSVWGSDVFAFPDRSWLHRRFLQSNLRSSVALGSTSHCMKARVVRLGVEADNIFVTPFGVDETVFTKQGNRQARDGSAFVIGTVKSLEGIYGIDVLIRSFADFYAGASNHKALKLKIYGEGSQKAALIDLTHRLKVGKAVSFEGAIKHDEVPGALSELDVFCALSREESFGVAAIEASACELPVIVSDAGGLPEVIVDGETGFVVPREDTGACARALEKLFDDEKLRLKFGRNGRRRVLDKYNWELSLSTMLAVYQEAIHRFDMSRTQRF